MGRMRQIPHCSLLFVSPWKKSPSQWCGPGWEKMELQRSHFHPLWSHVLREVFGELVFQWGGGGGGVTMFAWVCHDREWGEEKKMYESEGQWKRELYGGGCIVMWSCPWGFEMHKGRSCSMQREWAVYLLYRNCLPPGLSRGTCPHTSAPAPTLQLNAPA